MSDRRARLAVTFRRYAEEARSRAATLHHGLAAGDLPAVLLQAHSLAGSGASVGAEAITAAARPIERLVLAIQEGSQPDDLATLTALAEVLTRAVADFDPDAALDAFMAEVFPQG